MHANTYINGVVPASIKFKKPIKIDFSEIDLYFLNKYKLTST